MVPRGAKDRDRGVRRTGTGGCRRGRQQVEQRCGRAERWLMWCKEKRVLSVDS